ncbi:mitochondrial import inner membrane translocase subunit Tim9-like [Neomonachus schauinslandi]|uniref:Mitochondrial import inner membrane translocase subunit Tim9-like n=1 Tax=Neomonachus schauinslandi TaxID=29088 RepID=A0A2Y9I1Z1_NEOSC|nr:mitochondrial import inner membrane translocase subunit Tim9-like [Neomonachus schauinslandi]
MAAQIPGSDQIKQCKKILGAYNKFTETSFLDSVTDHTTKEVKPDETTFQEYRMQQNKGVAAKAGLLANHDKEVLGWTLKRRLPTATALEMRIHLISRNA